MKSFWYVLIILWGSPSQLGIGLLFRWSCTTCSNPSLDHIVLAQPGLLPPLCSTGVQILIREDLTRISQHWWFLKASMQQQIPTPNDTMRSQETPTVCYWWCKWLWNWGTTNSSGFSSFASFKLLFGDIPVYVYIYVYIPYIHPYIYIIYTHPYIYISNIYIPIYPNFQMGIQFSEPLVLRRSRGHRIKAGSAVPLRKKPTIKRRMIRFFHLSWVKQWLIVVNNG